MGNLKGTSLIAIKGYLRERYGEEALAQILAQLTPEERQKCAKDLPVSWVPAELVRRLYQAAIHTVGDGTTALCREVGLYNANKDLPKFFQYTISKTNPTVVFRFMGIIWKMYHDTGKFSVGKLEPGFVTLEISDFGNACDEICADITGYCEGLLKLYKLRNTRVAHTLCMSHGDPACVFEGRWEP